MLHLDDKKILVLLSGGLDSTILLFWAARHYDEVHALTFDYNQRNVSEIESAQYVAFLAKAATHEVVTLPVFEGNSSLINSNSNVEQKEELQKLNIGEYDKSFVFGRNIVFLAYAANRACVLGAKHIGFRTAVEGTVGYPDGSTEFVQKMEAAMNAGIFDAPGEQGLRIISPGELHSKTASLQVAAQWPDCMHALAYTHTCYDGKYPPSPFNTASLLRAKTFRDLGMADPLIVRAKSEGLLPADYPDHGYMGV